MGYIVYKQGVVQGGVELDGEHLRYIPTMEKLSEGHAEMQMAGLRRLVESMRYESQNDKNLYASLPKRLVGFVYVIEHEGGNSIKGGPGSGNFGHAGRPGRLCVPQARPGGNIRGRLFGAVVALPVSLGDYLTVVHYSDQQIDTDKPVVTHPAHLPAVAPGHTRIYHGLSMADLQSVLDQGLQFGSTTGKKEALPFIMGVIGTESTFGEVNVVFDVSDENPRWRKVNDDWVEILEPIAPERIVGVYLLPYRVSATPESMAWLRDTMEEYTQLKEQ